MGRQYLRYCGSGIDPSICGEANRYWYQSLLPIDTQSPRLRCATSTGAAQVMSPASYAPLQHMVRYTYPPIVSLNGAVLRSKHQPGGSTLLNSSVVGLLQVSMAANLSVTITTTCIPRSSPSPRIGVFTHSRIPRRTIRADWRASVIAGLMLTNRKNRGRLCARYCVGYYHCILLPLEFLIYMAELSVG